MLPVETIRPALEEFRESLEWYEVQSETAAIQFDEAVQATLAKIASDPYRFVIVDDPFRACSVVPYPFRIIYAIEPERILVVAIAHTSRRPFYWHGGK